MQIVEHELKISPDYQYNALRKGNVFQRQWHKNRLNLVEFLNFLNSEEVVADIGCGSGNVVFEFAKNVKHVVGFDYNKESLDFVKNKLLEFNILNTETCEFDVLGAFPEKFKNFFDKIILNEVIEHFDRSEMPKIFNNLRGMLKEGGQILITTPNYKASFWPVMEFLVDKFNVFPKLWGEQHKIKFTDKTLSRICAENGFRVIKNGTFGHLSPFVAIFGTKIADKLAGIEIEYLKVFGPQLFIIIKKQKHE